MHLYEINIYMLLINLVPLSDAKKLISKPPRSTVPPPSQSGIYHSAHLPSLPCTLITHLISSDQFCNPLTRLPQSYYIH